MCRAEHHADKLNSGLALPRRRRRRYLSQFFVVPVFGRFVLRVQGAKKVVCRTKTRLEPSTRNKSHLCSVAAPTALIREGEGGPGLTTRIRSHGSLRRVVSLKLPPLLVLFPHDDRMMTRVPSRLDQNDQRDSSK